VVPENVDAVRGLLGTAEAAESRARTNDALGIGLLEQGGRSRIVEEPTPR
jgi:hypothetical protein